MVNINIIRNFVAVYPQIRCWTNTKRKNMKPSTQIIINDISRLKAKTLPKDGRLILFGSQARGDARAESDWDLLMLFNKERLEQGDFATYAYPFVELGLSYGEYFSVKQYTFKEWEKRKGTPFYKNVTKDGIVI